MKDIFEGIFGGMFGRVVQMLYGNDIFAAAWFMFIIFLFFQLFICNVKVPKIIKFVPFLPIIAVVIYGAFIGVTST